MLKTVNLKKDIKNNKNTFKILKDINLEVKEGEFLSIMGPSGAGKTTLLNILSTVDKPTSGNVYYENKDISKMNNKELSRFRRDNIGFIFQDYNLLDSMSVEDNIALPLVISNEKQKTIKSEILRLAKFFGIEAHLKKYPYELSGGQKQRVSLAGVLGNDAEILLFDEPLANLDPASGKEVMELVNSIHEKTNKTIIIVEHRIEDVLEQAFDKVIVIDRGEVKAIGTPDDILKSDILSKSGLREPLYVSAMKYANCNLDKINNLRDFNNLDEDSKEKIKNWFNNESKNISMKNNNKEEKILEVRNLTFSHDKNKNKNTLENVSFHLNKGEILAVLGNNGAGKSTLCRVITGILKSKEGNIFLKDECIDSWSISKRCSSIGYVMQNPNQMISQHMIKDEIALGLKCRGYSKEEIYTKVEEVLKICGLYPYRNWPVTALSYGQKKRVTIASILAINPDVIILDEPTAGQDHKHYTEFMEFIKTLANKGISIILITHDMQLTLEYCDRAMVLSAGKKIADNKPSCILTDENIIKQANLKETSLSTLAKAIGMETPDDFVQFFIDYER